MREESLTGSIQENITNKWSIYLPDGQASIHRDGVHADRHQHVLLAWELAGRVPAQWNCVLPGNWRTLPRLHWRGGGLWLGEVVQDEPDDGDCVTINVVSEDDGILLKTDLSQTVEEVAVHRLWWLVWILWLWSLEVVDTLTQRGVSEP